MIVYWVSRHDPLPAQERELRRLFGPTTRVVQCPDPYANAQEIVRRYRKAVGDDDSEMVVVAPLSVIQRLVEMGIRPLWAEMTAIPTNRIRDPDREVWAGRVMRFQRFRRIVGVNIEYEEL